MMVQKTSSIVILGRQPALGFAELESLFGADKIQPVQRGVAHVDCDSQSFPMSRLGGTMKAARYLTDIPSTEWGAIEAFLVKTLPNHVAMRPPGKIRLGLSVYGLTVSIQKLNATGLTLKKAIRNAPQTEGRSIRIVPNKSLELNTAQIIHNQLTGQTGIDLLLIRDKHKTILAQTFAVQDIEAYAARDQARPKRDARVGMLPPKLAQIIANLALSDANPLHGGVLLDPFCGTGVVLQEATLMGFDVYGTDLEPRMIEYSEANLSWLQQTQRLPAGDWQLAIGDATTHQWNFSKIQDPSSTVSIACETYLGQPFSAEPSPEKLRQVMQDVDTIHRKFLQNVARQTEPGFRMCIAVPAWKTKQGFKHLKTLDSLEELGYNRVSFVHADTRDLVYHRENQVVGRELVTLIRK